MTRWRRAGKLGDSRQHFPPMCERDADLFRIRIRQMAEHRDINVVLGKTLSVLRKTQLPSQSATRCIAAKARGY